MRLKNALGIPGSESVKLAPVAAVCLAVVCFPYDSNAQVSPSTHAGADSLPIEQGYYVRSDTLCQEASNATLTLYDGKSFGHAHAECRSPAIRKLDDGSYLVTEQCRDTQVRDGTWMPLTTGYAVVSRTEVVSITPFEKASYRICKPSDLPEPWRTNGLVPASTEAVLPDEMAPVSHNGSQMVLTKTRNGRVEIRYSIPRHGLPVKDGDLLFEGQSNIRGRYTGTAYVFKDGCPPAPYAVEGNDVRGDIVLFGNAPIREPGSCAIVGSKLRGRDSRLVFSFEPD